MRRFRRDPIDEADMAALLRLAQLAPSVGHSQPWRFVRLRSPHVREALARHVDEEAERAAAAYADPARQAAYRTLKLHGLHEAPEVLAVFSDEATEAGAGLGAATMPEARAYSVVMAIHTLWLAARARGIAVGWVSILRPDRLREIAAAPPAWKPVALLCVGFAEAEDARPELETRGWQPRLDWRDHIFER